MIAVLMSCPAAAAEVQKMGVEGKASHCEWWSALACSLVVIFKHILVHVLPFLSAFLGP